MLMDLLLFSSACVSLDLLSCLMSLPLAPQTGEVTLVTSYGLSQRRLNAILAEC
jgi:hypothetical protein